MIVENVKHMIASDAASKVPASQRAEFMMEATGLVAKNKYDALVMKFQLKASEHKGATAHGHKGGGSTSSKANITCHNCKKRGHYANECRSSRGGQSRGGSRSSSRDSSRSPKNGESGRHSA